MSGERAVFVRKVREIRGKRMEKKREREKENVVSYSVALLRSFETRAKESST